MEVSSHLRFARVSSQKCRLVVDMVRGKKIQEAMQILDFCNKKSARLIKITLVSAVANAEHNHGLDIDNLRVSTAFVNEAPMMKRSHARAKGRGARVVKHSCHITLKVSEA